MQTDLYFVLGLVVGILAIPAIFSAVSEGRVPRAAAIMVMISGGLIVLAVSQKPGGYALNEIPDVFARVVGHYIN
ncbi:hypothetical protein ACP2AV_02715 [Aliiroseovarius sp. PTFE2010]|uniref:hypothetical protein n=1 Tax=Aliiroseovarius sp. PTFE2010 TaxID=3417190 RepID=UPI003CFA0581